MTVAFENVMQNSYLETQRIFFLEESNSVIEIGSDRFLDLVIQFNRHFKELNVSMVKLNEAVENSMSTDTDELLIQKLPGLKSLVEACTKTLEGFRDSSFYSGVQTELEAYSVEVDSLAEFVGDIIRKTKTVKEDNDFLNLINDINSL